MPPSPKVCSVCSHPKRLEIDQKLAEKQPLRVLGAEYGLTAMALSRHNHHDSKPVNRVKMKLKPRQAAFIREAAKGGQTIEKAALKAGYAPSVARLGLAGVSQSREVQELLRAEINRTIPVSKLVERLAEGLDAKEFRFFSVDGKVSDVKAIPDFKERREYLALVAKFGRYFEEKVAAVTVELDTRPLEELIEEARQLTDELSGRQYTGQGGQTIDIEQGD